MGSFLIAALLVAPDARAAPKDDARRHFAAGLSAAKSGDYEIALQRFLAAQEAWPHPATLYNIAKAYTDLDDLGNALTYYRLFREAAPDRAAEVDPVIAVLEARLGQPAGAAPLPGRGAPVSGPTDEELSRLDAIARELAALTEALQDRSREDVPPVAPIPEPGGTPEDVIVESDFLEEAYEKVVVTASRVGQEPLDSPATVTVLTADDIRLSGVVDLPDLLRRVVGVEVMSMTTGHSDIAIRGFQRKLNNKVLILIDGQSTYLDFLGATLWGSMPIALEEIERIEVIRGPGSAVYGANAVTGVVNIITRTPGEGDQVVSASVGTTGLSRGSAVASVRSGATAYRLSAGFDRRGRWAREADLDRGDGQADAPAVTYFEDDDLGSEVLRANARVDRTFGGWGAVSASGGIASNRSEFYAPGALPNYGMELDHRYLRGDLFVADAHLRAFWNDTSGTTGPWLQYPGERDLNNAWDNDVVDVEGEAPLAFETGPVRHQFNAGGGWRYKAIRFSYLEGGFDTLYIENHLKAFVNEQATVGRFSAVASLRLDRHPLIGLSRTISPRGALLLRALEKTSVRLTAGSAYRAPSALESYMLFALPTPADGAYILDYGNRDLSPERITTLELGVHDESTFYHQADVVVYFNRVTDLIDLRDVAPSLMPFDPRYVGIELGDTGWINLDPIYTAAGLEADLELFPTDGLDLFANLAVSRTIRTEDQLTAIDRSSSPLRVNLGGSYRTPYRTDVSLWANWQSPQQWGLRAFDPETLAIAVVDAPLPSRLLTSARLATRPLPDQDFEIAVTAWNFTELLSDGYREHPEGQPVVGRLYGTATWRF